MSFHLSAQNIRIEDRSCLKADIADEDGNTTEVVLDLNTVIGNNEGSFEWGGENFAYTADPDAEIYVSIEGEDQPILRARLADSNGEYYDRDINLAERISNVDGQLVFE